MLEHSTDRMSTTAGLGVLVWALAPCLGLASGQTVLPLRVVAAEGDAAPVVPPANFLSVNVQSPSGINRGGSAAFWGVTQGTSGRFAFVEWPGGLTRSVPNASVNTNSPLILANNGTLVYQSLSGNQHSLWYDTPTGGAELMRSLQPAPGTTGLVYGVVQEAFNAGPAFVANDSGVVAFRATFGPAAGGPGFVGIFVGTPGSIALRDRTGAGTPIVTDVGSPVINADGAVAYYRVVNASAPARQIVVATSPSDVQVIAAGGQQAPGLPGGVQFAQFLPSISINASNNVVFLSRLVGPNISSINDDSVWARIGSSLQLIAREGDPVSGVGLPANWVFTQLGNFDNPALPPIIADDDTVAFYCGIGATPGQQQQALALRGPAQNGPHVVLRATQAVPGPVFSSITSVWNTSSFRNTMQLNSSGELLASVATSGGGAALLVARRAEDAYEVQTLWALGMTAQARGETLAFAPANLGGGSFYPSGGSDGRSRIWNDQRDVVFHAALPRIAPSVGFFSATFVARVPLSCDTVDFNTDFLTQDPTDLEAFLSVYSGGPCIPASQTCNDIDFNNDGLESPDDIEAFLSVYSGGPCL